MVGNFAFTNVPQSDAITVNMRWSVDAQRVGSLNLPKQLGLLLEEADFPSASGEMALESAVSYGIFLAMRSDTPLLLCGDRTVWNPSWGDLSVAAHARALWSVGRNKAGDA